MDEDKEIAIIRKKDLLKKEQSAFGELQELNWIKIVGYPYVMKYKLHQDSCTLMVSNLTAIFGERLEEEEIEERFKLQNPYVEMLPEIILKHLKKPFEKLSEHKEAEVKIDIQDNIIAFLLPFKVGDLNIFFKFELRVLSSNQFVTHLLRPILLKAVILDEDKTALKRKIEELEGRLSSSSGCAESKKLKAVYSTIRESDPPEPGVIEALLYLQEVEVVLPKCLKVPVSENNSEVKYKPPCVRHLIKSDIFTKTEATEDNSNVKESSVREVTEDSNETSASKPTPYFKPSPAKKKKILKF